MEVGSGHQFIPIYILFVIISLQELSYLQGFWRILRVSNTFLSFISIHLNWGHNGGIFICFHKLMPPFCLIQSNKQKGNENHASL